MKLTNEVKDADHIEIPVFVNGSFAEKLQLTGKELKRLIAMLHEPINTSEGLPVKENSDGSITIESTDPTVFRTDTDHVNVHTDELPPGTTINNTAGDEAKEVRKNPEQRAGDEAAEKRDGNI